MKKQRTVPREEQAKQPWNREFGVEYDERIVGYDTTGHPIERSSPIRRKMTALGAIGTGLATVVIVITAPIWIPLWAIGKIVERLWP